MQWCVSTPSLWHLDASRGRPPHRLRTETPGQRTSQPRSNCRSAPASDAGVGPDQGGPKRLRGISQRTALGKTRRFYFVQPSDPLAPVQSELNIHLTNGINVGKLLCGLSSRTWMYGFPKAARQVSACLGPVRSIGGQANPCFSLGMAVRPGWCHPSGWAWSTAARPRPCPGEELRGAARKRQAHQRRLSASRSRESPTAMDLASEP